MNGGTGRHLEYEYRDEIFRNFIYTVYRERDKSQSTMISTTVICAKLEKAAIQVQVTSPVKFLELFWIEGRIRTSQITVVKG